MKTFTSSFIKKAALALLLCIQFVAADAQFVTTVPPLAGVNNQSGISFNAKALANLTIKEIWASFLTGTYTVTVWYNPDSINGAPTISTVNGWVQLCTNVPLTVVGGGVGIIQQIPNAFNLPMNAGDVFGFYVEATNMPNAACLYYTDYVPPAQFIFGNADMYINAGNGNVGYGGPSPNPTFSPRMFNGKLVYQLGPAPPPDCTDKPTNVTITGLQKTSAVISWDPTPNAVSYEYVVDQTFADPPSSGYNYTSTTSFSLANLAAGTCYYIHLRAVCNIPDLHSDWILDSVCTIPECEVPTVTIEKVLSTSAIARWNAVPGAYGYEYSVGVTPNPPLHGANTTYTNVELLGLTPNTPLYFYLRAKCNPTPLSEWGVTPFHTMWGLNVDDDDKGGSLLQVYPNPIRDVLRLELGADRQGTATVYISDIAGRVVKQQKMDKNILNIDMSGFVKGMYLLKYQDDIHSKVIKIVKE